MKKIINTPNKLLNIDKFIFDIKSIYPNNEYLNNRQPELICQFPLKTEIFKFFYVNDNQNWGLGVLNKQHNLYKKYIKYKLVKLNR